MGDFREAPRLNDQSDRVSILGVRTSKDRCLDRSAKLWIIAEPDVYGEETSLEGTHEARINDRSLFGNKYVIHGFS
jgi:hypothetical protein